MLLFSEKGKEHDRVLLELVLDHEKECLGDDGLGDLCLHALQFADTKENLHDGISQPAQFDLLCT